MLIRYFVSELQTLFLFGKSREVILVAQMRGILPSMPVQLGFRTGNEWLARKRDSLSFHATPTIEP